jgi:hypothetical protein
MAENELDGFLNGKSEPEAAPVEQAPEPVVEAAPAQPEPEVPPEPEDAEPASADGRTVPLAVLQAQRKDHKERAARLEGELAELRRQFEEVSKRAQQAPQPQQQAPAAPQWINPAEDPAGYHARVQELMINERLNISEMQAREKHGDAQVEAAVKEFQQAAEADPSLRTKLYSQPHPYAWMMKQVEAIRVQREIGDDPAAFRAKIRAEIEAELAAKSAPQQEAPLSAPAPRVPNLQPSLATARSAAPRGAPAYSGPVPLTELFPR